jgi:hypothetical protein
MMHWSGIVRLIVAPVVAALIISLHYWVSWSWWWAAVAGLMAFIGIPVLIGLCLGVADRRERMRQAGIFSDEGRPR